MSRTCCFHSFFLILTIFCLTGSARNMITEKYFLYDFTGLPFNAPLDANLADAFAFRFRLGQKPDINTTLFEVPGAVKLTIRNVPDSPESWWDNRENFRSIVEPDGRCRVLEITIFVTHPDRPNWKSMSIGCPLQLLGENWGEREIVMLYDTIHLRLFIDGELVNENYPVGRLNAPTAPIVPPNTAIIKDFAIATDLRCVSRQELIRTRPGDAQYYMPTGFNLWAGDCVAFFHDSTYHLLYLVDRHHHGNRWGGGAHLFQQLTTQDFKNWTEHGPLFELESQWESVGTGTMFHHNGQYIMGFGWHTSRVVPPERTASSLLNAECAREGVMKMHTYDDLKELVPSGASYATSKDGIHFTKSRKVIHTAENPSIYTAPDGALNLYCGSGTWSAPTVDGPWKRTAPDFPKAGPSQPMRNTSECPSFFSWNGWNYLLMGGTGFWLAKGNGEYVDSAAQGRDIYDGLFVPMVAPFTGNRQILCGWLNGQGWASCIVCRELIQYPDGHLGMKWVEEMRPQPQKQLQKISGLLLSNQPATFEVPENTSLLLQMTFNAPSTGRFAIRLLNAQPSGADTEYQLDFGRERTQISGCGQGNELFHPIMTVREAIRDIPQENSYGANLKSPDGLHSQGHNFCLENVDVMKGTVTLNLAVMNSSKLRGSVVDVEIAGQRTLVSQRPRLNAKHVAFLANTSMSIQSLVISTMDK